MYCHQRPSYRYRYISIISNSSSSKECPPTDTLPAMSRLPVQIHSFKCLHHDCYSRGKVRAPPTLRVEASDTAPATVSVLLRSTAPLKRSCSSNSECTSKYSITCLLEAVLWRCSCTNYCYCTAKFAAPPTLSVDARITAPATVSCTS